MYKGKGLKLATGVLFLTLFFNLNVSLSNASSNLNNYTLKMGAEGVQVEKLQTRLKQLGLFDTNVTGYFGEVTKNAIIKFQKKNGYTPTGIANEELLDSIYSNKPAAKKNDKVSSRGSVDRDVVALTPWFDGVENIFSIGTKATITDVDTGISFRAQRTGVSNHSDTETLSNEDTQLMKKIYSGQWGWERRAVIVTIGDIKIAGSMTGMPHAGREDMPERIFVSNRSAGYGSGINYDSIKENGMSGHFDIHFLGSKTHSTNRVDEEHQKMVHKAFKSQNSR